MISIFFIPNWIAVFDEKKTYIEKKTLLTHIQLLSKPFQKISVNFINDEKIAYHTIFIYGNCMISVFFIPNWNAVFAERKTYIEPKTLLTHIQSLNKPFKKISENFINDEKNAYHTISIYGNCMISIFFIPNWNAVFAEKTTYLEPKPLFYFIQLLKKPFQKISENFINNEKNAYHTISIYGNCMIKVFFKKQKPQFFHHTTVLLESNSRRN